MFATDDKILNAVIDSFSIEDLENIIKKKKSENEPVKMTYEEKYAMDFEEWYKKKLFAPKQ